MIREATVNLARKLYPPLDRAGQRHVRKPSGNMRRQARQPVRYPVLDNARFALIALVVAGHLLERLVDQGPIAAALYRWIYLFHMPAFVLISGAVSKSMLTRRRVFALVTGLLLPYVIFQTLYPAWDAWLFDSGDWSQGYLTPYWLLWYLPSLACWRLLLPLFARLKFALPVSVAIALAAGLAPWIGYPLSLSRTLVFFPLFLLGHHLGGQRLQQLGESPVRKGVALAILVAAAAGAWLLRDFDPQWLYASVGYGALDIAAPTGLGIRFALLAASSACALSVLTLLPRRSRWSGFGRHSLDAYLLHGFLVRAALAAGVFSWLGDAMPEAAVLVVVVACGWMIAATLSTRVIDRMARPLLCPTDWLLERWRSVPWRAMGNRLHASRHFYQ